MCLVFVSVAVIIGALEDSLIYRLMILLPDQRPFKFMTSMKGWLVKETLFLPLWLSIAFANLLILPPQSVSVTSSSSTRSGGAPTDGP